MSHSFIQKPLLDNSLQLTVYSLYGHPLEAVATVASEKDLGVVFSSDLKVRRQCEEAYSKASQMLG